MITLNGNHLYLDTPGPLFYTQRCQPRFCKGRLEGRSDYQDTRLPPAKGDIDGQQVPAVRVP